MSKKKLLLEIAIPVYNEEVELEKNILTLHRFLTKNLKKFIWQITIADNASTDKSRLIALKLTKSYKEIKYIYCPRKGRGNAVKLAWQKASADLFMYMDVDLSTDLLHLLNVLDALTCGFDIAIGSRLLPVSRVSERSLKREVMSRSYNFLIELLFGVHFSDAQCGFKAVTRQIVTRLVPHIRDNEWFFDSELLIVAEKLGYRIYEEPVIWVDNPGSTVKVLKTVTGDLLGLWRLFWTKPWDSIKMTGS